MMDENQLHKAGCLVNKNIFGLFLNAPSLASTHSVQSIDGFLIRQSLGILGRSHRRRLELGDAWGVGGT